MTSNDEVITKKCRIWNPALDDCCNAASDNDKGTISVNFQSDHISQNYTNLMQPYSTAPVQSDYARGMENHHNTAMSFRLNIMLLPNYLMNTMLNPNFSSLNVPNQNCCAVCGSIFRLTADLVQHMRINHRTKHSQPRKRISPR
uniref:C2H2-type domain-containing protein n=1 Tax=Elaeophora elaphi TaxID=1147741 RepID=A0A0R3S3K2_9BILA